MKNCFKRFAEKLRNHTEETEEPREDVVVPVVPEQKPEEPCEPSDEPETEEDKKKQEGAIEIFNAEGGFFIVTYDKDGFCHAFEYIGENKAAYCASKLSDLIAKAQLEYINWRSSQRPSKDGPRVTEKK